MDQLLHRIVGFLSGAMLTLSLSLVAQPLHAQDFAGGDGSQANPYQIETWEHLNNIRNHMSAHFVLNNDLTPETQGYATHVKDGATLANGGKGWDPLGECVEEGPELTCFDFTGTFNGNYQAIVGLEIARSSESEIGLFGRIGSAATVTQLSLVAVDVSGSQSTGGLAGINQGAILDVSVQGAVTGQNGNTGGAVGYNASAGTLSKTGFYGSVQGEDSTGGLAGFNTGTLWVSWARAQVTSTQARVGGAVGNNQGTVYWVFTSGQVTGVDLVGGLVGVTFDSITRAYAQTNVTATSGGAGGLIGKIGNTTGAVSVSQSYSTGTVSGNSDSRGLVGAGTRTENSGPFAISDSFWDVEASGIGSVGEDDVGAIGKTTADMKKQATFTGWNFTANTGDWIIVEDQTYPSLHLLAYAGGEGTSANPYQIATWEHLNNIRLKKNSNFELTQNLDAYTAGYTALVKDGSTLADGGQGWAPIGKTNTEFKGVMDGANRSISNLEIARGSESQVGLFGATAAGGLVENLTLLNASVTGGFQTGGLVGNVRVGAGVSSNIRIMGQVTSSTSRIGCLIGENYADLTNAHADCTVSGGSSVGGLIGDNRATVQGSSSAGSVTGSTGVGGLVGHNINSVQQSFSRAAVTGGSEVGGLIGSNFSEVNNTYAIGAVTGTNTDTTSGLVGSNGSSDGFEDTQGGNIQNSYAAGVVNGGDPARGFVGTSVNDSLFGGPSYIGNVFDSDVSGQSAATDSSAAAKTTSQMKTKATYTDAGWDFSADGIWSVETCVYASYPYLKAINYDSPQQTPSVLPIPGLVQDFGAPTSVIASASDTEATISWDPPAGCDGSLEVTGYTVTATPGGATCTTTDSTSCTVTGLSNGTPYTFQVVASSANGDSASSAPSNAVTPATTPDAPTITSVTAGNAEVMVHFNPPSNNGGLTITSYTAISDPSGLTGSCDASPCSVSGLTNGVAYTFTVTATNGVGTGSASGPSNTVTPATTPSAPTIASLSAGNGAVTLEFSAPDNGGSEITGYIITASPGPKTFNCTESPCTVTGLTNGTSYTFSVVASNALGAGPASELSDKVAPLTVPAAPSNLVAYPSLGSIKIAFDAGDTGGSPIKNYEYSLNGGTSWTPLTPATTASPITITGLVNNTEYSVMLRAINAAGAGSASLAVTACPSAMIFKDAFRQGGGNASSCP